MCDVGRPFGVIPVLDTQLYEHYDLSLPLGCHASVKHWDDTLLRYWDDKKGALG
ncbi:MAG: hypothetical protein ACR5LB_09130 [Wolbachia sp.]